MIDWKPDAGILRKFGLGGLLMLPLLAWLLHSRGAGPAWVWSVAGIGLATGVLALIAPRLLAPLYLLVTLVSLPIGFVVNLLLLAFVFYGMLLPLGLVFRLLGRDALQRKLEPARKSYWQAHVAPKDARRYFKQF